MKYTFKELSALLNRSVPSLKWIYQRKGAKNLFEYTVINKHRFCVLDEKNLDKLKAIIYHIYYEPKQIHKKWSYSALECYNNKMICKNCNTYDIACKFAPHINGKPPMKFEVLRLISKYGVPNNDNQ